MSVKACLCLALAGGAGLSALASRAAAQATEVTLDWNTDVVAPLGTTPRLAVDGLGVPHVMYGSSAGGVQHSWKTASGWDHETALVVGEGPWDMTLDQDGYPHAICRLNGEPTYAWRDASGWWYEPIEPPFASDYDLSIALGIDGQPRVALKETGDTSLWLATRVSPANWDVCLMDSYSNPGRYSALQIDASGAVHAFYSTWAPFSDPIYTRGGCSTAQTFDLDPLNSEFDTYRGVGLALDALDQPQVTFHHGNALLFKGAWNGAGFDLEQIWDGGGKYSWLELGPDGSEHVLARIDETSGASGLAYIRRSAAGWVWSTVTSSNASGGKRAVALSPDGRVAVVYVASSSEIVYATPKPLIIDVTPDRGNIVGGTLVEVTLSQAVNAADTVATVDGQPAEVIGVSGRVVTICTPAVLEPTGLPVDVAVDSPDGEAVAAGAYMYTPCLDVSVTGSAVTGGTVSFDWRTDPGAQQPQLVYLWLAHPSSPSVSVVANGFAGVFHCPADVWILQGFPASFHPMTMGFAALPAAASGLDVRAQAAITGEGGSKGSFTNVAEFEMP